MNVLEGPAGPNAGGIVTPLERGKYLLGMATTWNERPPKPQVCEWRAEPPTVQSPTTLRIRTKSMCEHTYSRETQDQAPG